MNNFECRTCGEAWSGAYNCDHRCTTCGDPIHAVDCETQLRRVKRELALARRDYEVMYRLCKGAEDERDALVAELQRLREYQRAAAHLRREA